MDGEIVRQERNELIVPWTGELIDLDRQPERIPELLEEFRNVRSALAAAIGQLTAHVAALTTVQGSKTLLLGGRKVVLSGGSETIWDVEELLKLLDLGLPESRYNELVTTEVSYKVNANVAKQLAGANPEYAAVINRAKTVLPKKPSAKVT